MWWFCWSGFLARYAGHSVYGLVDLQYFPWVPSPSRATFGCTSNSTPQGCSALVKPSAVTNVSIGQKQQKGQQRTWPATNHPTHRSRCGSDPRLHPMSDGFLASVLPTIWQPTGPRTLRVSRSLTARLWIMGYRTWHGTHSEPAAFGCSRASRWRVAFDEDRFKFQTPLVSHGPKDGIDDGLTLRLRAVPCTIYVPAYLAIMQLRKFHVRNAQQDNTKQQI
ncbi:hypothetical protein QBC45DRAFT_202422 [Copromyces sp. CBS 386.78]|nr:hypothetical protein QBC45DRAFT_202422 [Copromyces sp. CBS 386.78]